MLHPPGPQTPLADVRDWVDLGRHEGVTCPACGQHAQVYRRPLYAAMSRALIGFYRAGGTEHWVHGPTIVGGTRADEAKLRYWELILESAGLREDGGRAGYWKVTPRGELFVRGLLTVPRYALIFNNACLGFDGPNITIQQSLGTRFDYRALMAGQG